MSKHTREQLFVREGLDKGTAQIADEASRLLPEQRTPEQRQAITIASKAIAENNRKLADQENGGV